MRTIDYGMCGCLLLAPLALNSKNNDAAKCGDAAAPRNVIFILSDDHRYDFMGFLGTVPWLETPAMDHLARNGAYLPNAFVATSLSSPSRATILTGMYPHEHTVVDNMAPLPENLSFFPQYLRQAGYATAFFGKWHIGHSDDAPKPGFDHWESFKGQGTYYDVELNIDGKRTRFPKQTYVTDLLTDHAMDFIAKHRDRPFFVYLSHKSVHMPFAASPANKGRYRDKPVPLPASFRTPDGKVHALPSIDSTGKAAAGEAWYGAGRFPDWVKHQRESWHGADYIAHGKRSLETEFRNYCETIKSLDDNIGRLLEFLRREGLDRSTLIIYMGDNGYCWGEHGLIDKRTFYEASVRVPLLACCPDMIAPGTVVEELVQNIDIAPTILQAAGLEKAPQMRGDSFLPLLAGERVESWRRQVFYEYYWDHTYPQTPTMFGVRTPDFKYTAYHGVWDTNEFFDLRRDPHETVNRIADPAYRDTIRRLSGELYDWLEQTDGMSIPLKRYDRKKSGGDHRNAGTY